MSAITQQGAEANMPADDRLDKLIDLMRKFILFVISVVVVLITISLVNVVKEVNQTANSQESTEKVTAASANTTPANTEATTLIRGTGLVPTVAAKEEIDTTIFDVILVTLSQPSPSYSRADIDAGNIFLEMKEGIKIELNGDRSLVQIVDLEELKKNGKHTFPSHTKSVVFKATEEPFRIAVKKVPQLTTAP